MHRFLAPVLLCLSAVSAFAAADPGLMALVPANAKIVSSVNVQQAWSSPFGQYVLTKSGAQGNGFDKMLKETGFDPRKDLQAFVFASPGPGTDPAQSSFVFIARGNFQTQWARKQVLSHGGSIQSVGGLDVYVGADHGQQTGFVLLENGLAAFGDLATVQQVIANRANTTTLDPTLQGLITKVSASNDAWFASLLPGSYIGKHLAAAGGQAVKPQATAINSVQQAAGGVQFGDPVQVTFDAVARSPKDATSLVDVFRFMASFIQMQRQQNPQTEMLASALDGMVLTADNNNFHMNVAIPEKSLEQLADSGMSRHHPATSDKQ
jgi:hypothetical protein